ncbi:hypothetical protein KR222_008133 [Zaprionus bogoriensis]|nr:hypothetical protein KR222_008133 [Zaprionus bogoriensis]
MEASEAESNINFGKFSAAIQEHFDDKIDLKQLCITRSVMNLADFSKSLQQNLQEEGAQRTPTKKLGTVAEYADLFKVLDTYPSNLQRVTKKRDLQRANSSTLKSNDTLQDQTVGNLSSPSMTLSSTLPHQGGMTAAEALNDFNKFKQKLRQVYEEQAALRKEQSAYLAKIAQLQQFAQQLEKLMPGMRVSPDAFTASEQANLMAIAENMQQLNYMRDNSLSSAFDARDTSSAARLELLVDVLNYTLKQITS